MPLFGHRHAPPDSAAPPVVTCPTCHEAVPPDALLCPHCKDVLPPRGQVTVPAATAAATVVPPAPADAEAAAHPAVS